MGMTLNCGSYCNDNPFEFYYGSYANKQCENVFNCAGYINPTLDDKSAIYYDHIDANAGNNDPINYDSFDSVTYDSLILFVNEGSYREVTCPDVTGCHIICIQRPGLTPGECVNMMSDFRLAQNGLLIGDSREMKVYGPSNQFKYQPINDCNVRFNEFNLSMTTTVNMACDCVNCQNCFEDSTIYVGMSQDVNIDCGGVSGCQNAKIFSDSLYSDNLFDNLWNIDCDGYTSSPGSCDEFLIDFVDNSCLYEWDGTMTVNNCTESVVVTSDPTMEPTNNPTNVIVDDTETTFTDVTVDESKATAHSFLVIIAIIFMSVW